ncbi:Hypothetical protein, putative [Bodo saltans]|uniref:Uncharacterized protein n=1 Tax=Bodo saltans TaxID=75058 RepID=A0A0S4IMP6_BODSA|nr:Hypothetical protein, putative [Bodo saltans]|eukprot:CUE72625.1 Hypothetical protein, putative [Bodo saltans]
MVAPATSAERLMDSGYGVIMFALTQRLLSLRERPTNPVEWITRRLKDREYFITEAGFETFLHNALRTAACRCEMPSAHDPHRVMMLSQMLVEVGCDMSHHYAQLQGGTLMEDSRMLHLAGHLADYFMWVAISTTGVRGDPRNVKKSMTMAQYVSYAASGLGYLVNDIRALTTERREHHMDLTVLDALFDLTEVLLKLRCFAAQAEVDVFEERCSPFPPSNGPSKSAHHHRTNQNNTGEEYDAADLALSISTRRSFRVVFLQSFAKSVDGVATARPTTSVELVERLFHLVGLLLSFAGFPSATVHCVATDAANVHHEAFLYESLRIRCADDHTPSTSSIKATMQPLRYLHEAVTQRKSSMLSTDNVTVVLDEEPSRRVTSSPPNSPPSSPTAASTSSSSGTCTHRVCHAIQRVAARCSDASSLTAVADVAPPCVVVLPVNDVTAVVAAPLPLLVGVVVAAHVGKAMALWQPPPPPSTLPTAVSQSPEEKKGSKRASKKEEPAATPPPPPADTGAPPADTSTASQEAAKGTTTAAARKSSFGDAYHILFPSTKEGVDGGADTPVSFLTVLLKPLSSIKRTRLQTACTHALALGLAQVLSLPSHAKPGKTFTAPMIGAVGFGWDILTSLQHSEDRCWWGQARLRAADTDATLVTLEHPLIRCLLTLKAALHTNPMVLTATALTNTFAEVLPTSNESPAALPSAAPGGPKVADATARNEEAVLVSILRGCLTPTGKLSGGFGDNPSVPSPKAAEVVVNKKGQAAAPPVVVDAPPASSPTSLQVEAAHTRLRAEVLSPPHLSPVGQAILQLFQRFGTDTSISDVAQAIIRAQAAHPHTK